MKWIPGGIPFRKDGRAQLNIIEFEETLWSWRRERYRHPPVDVVNTGFRPVSGQVADFGVAERDGRWHFFYIERRLQEGTPFYPGNEIYFGHASTANFLGWEVHDPVMLIRPGTWEGAHVWAPVLMPWEDGWVMAYTGVNREISQDIGLAFSEDLFEWRRWERNPISPCRGREWADWREDRISSCRDPHLFQSEGRVWMTYTANTRRGASCVALASSADLEEWEDHGPILEGPAEGYEPRLEGGHPQGSLESSHLIHRAGRWLLFVNASIRGFGPRCWVFESEDMFRFVFERRREFWPGGGGVELIRERGSRALLACFSGGHIRFGVADWSEPEPAARFVQSAEELSSWAG